MGSTVKSGAVIFARDVGLLARFYERVVPLVRIAEEDGAIRLENETVQLVIHVLPAAMTRTMPDASPPALRQHSAIKPVFAVDSLERARAAAAELGGGLNPAASAFVWAGFRACDGHDPEGNVLQFREPADEVAN